MKPDTITFNAVLDAWARSGDRVAPHRAEQILDHMDERGARVVVPALRPEEADMPRLPWIDPEDFNPGYIRRGLHLLPQQGDHLPWRMSQDYWGERDTIPEWDLDDGTLTYS